MKNQITTALALLLAGAIAIVITTQQGRSQSGPPPQAVTFNGHYKEVDTTIEVGGTSEFFSLPIFDRPIHLVVSCTEAGGNREFTFADQVFFYRSTAGELHYDTGSGPILPENFPDGFWLAAGLSMMIGTNGTVAIRLSPDLFTTPGSVHVAMWY